MTSGFRTLDQADVKSKRVLLRVDLNVPMEDGKVTDATRLARIAPTIVEVADKGGRVILLAHFGRPKGAIRKNRSSPSRTSSPTFSTGPSALPKTASAKSPRRRSRR